AGLARRAGVGLAEALEDVGQEVGRDADAGVADRHLDVRGDALQPDLDPPAPPCGLPPSGRPWPRPPRPVNLTALVSRFHSTCRSRSGSPEIGPTPGSRIVWMRTPLASAAGCTVATALSTITGSCTGWTSRRILPETIRDTSRTSAMIWLSQLALRSTVSSPRVCLSPDSSPPRSSRA